MRPGFCSLVAAVCVSCVMGNAEAQSVLANAAAAMQPGTWAEIQTLNIEPVLANTGGASGTTLSYADDAVWDPVTHRLFFIGGDHDPASGCPRFLSYTESTNTWQILPNASWFQCGAVSRMHGLNHNAINVSAGKLYHRPFGDMVVRKYDIASQTWSDLPVLASDVMGYNQCCVAIAWFPERNALEYASIENGTFGALVEYSDTTGRWSRVAGNLPMGQYQNFGKYDPVNKVFLFGGGEGDRHVYKLDSAGVVTAMSNAPTDVGILDTVVTPDPISGQYLFLDNSNRFYAYDVNTDRWTQLAASPILAPPVYDPPTNGIIVAPIPEYGVNLYARCYVNECHAYLYKHVSAAPDVTPPTMSAVSATNITASHATISWTTNEPADTRVNYGLGPYTQSTPLVSTLVTAHSAEIFSLTPRTTYHFEARSADASGNGVSSGDLTFTTSAPDTTPPVISGVGTANVTSTGATIVWTTNEVADSQVEYGTTTAYGTLTPLNTALVTTHAVNVTGLSAGGVYHFRVRSKDADSNTAASGDFTLIASRGPIAAYAFDEGSSVVAADASGNGVTGSLINGATWTTGKSGNAVLFDGVNDKVTLPSTFDVTVPFTVEAWIRPTSYARWLAIFSKRAAYSQAQMRFDVGLRITDGAVYVTNGSLQQSLYSPALNTWTHLAVVADASGTRIYGNGTLQGTLPAFVAGTAASAPVAIGSSADDEDKFIGAIDDLRIYNRALTQSEVQSDLATPAGGSVLHINQPAAGGSVVGSTVSVAYTITGDATQVDHARFTLDATPTVDDPTFDGSYVFANIAVGSHVLSGYLVRADGGKIVGSDASVTFSTAPPDVTPPSAPSALTATAAGATQISLTWTASTDDVGVAQYTVETCANASCSFAIVGSTNGTTYSVNGLTANTGYSFRVLAADAALNVSGYSNVATATTAPVPPTTPTLSASVSGNQINLSWTASSSSLGIADYVLERCAGSSCAGFASIATTTATSYTDGGLAPATYSYRVLAHDTAGNASSYSNSATATVADTTPPTAPTNLGATTVSATQINLSWTAATDNVGVTGYRLERCQGAGCSNFAQIATTSGTTFNNTGLTASTSYSYRVRAVDAASNLGNYSNNASAITTAVADTTAPSVPTGLAAAAASPTQINLIWNASTDNVAVTGYQIDRCQGANCANSVVVGSSAVTSFSDSGLLPSTTYRYRVRATDAAGNFSGYTGRVAATTPAAADTTPPSTPATLTATPISTVQINLAWAGSTDNLAVTGYRVERCQGAGCANFAQIATPTGTSYSDGAGLSPATSYSYRVRAADAAGNLSPYSVTATAATLAGGGSNGPVVALAFNENAGTTAIDSSGNGFTGTLSNGPVWAAGKNGNALSFDGIDDKVTLPSTLDVAALPFTLEAWVRPTNYSPYHDIFSKRTTYSTAGMRFEVLLWDGTGQVVVATYRTMLFFNYSPPVNTWTHVAVVASSTGTQLYVNSVLQQSLGAVTLGTGSGAAVNVGQTADNDDPFAGAIDDLRLYKRALTPPEIQFDMNTPVAP